MFNLTIWFVANIMSLEYSLSALSYHNNKISFLDRVIAICRPQSTFTADPGRKAKMMSNQFLIDQELNS
jgi:hypothetical protein